MTSSIPSGFSNEQLQDLLAKAQVDPAETTHQCIGDQLDPEASDYEERITQVAHDSLEFALNQINDPMVHKAMLIAICNNFIEFHNDVAEKIAEKGDLTRAAAWMRDAGKFQSIVNITATVVCGENDFLSTDE